MISDKQTQTDDLRQTIEYLQKPSTIRSCSQQVFDFVEQGLSSHFTYQPETWPKVVELVCDVTKANYPDLKIPLHSRWRHFEVGDPKRLEALLGKYKNLPHEQMCQGVFELVVVSVLLDAGAGPDWSFFDKLTQKSYGRSEGLALASLALLEHPHFQDKHNQSHRVSAQSLSSLTLEVLASAFQVSAENPLVGLQGRWQLLQKLGHVLEKYEDVFKGRLGNLYQIILAQDKHTEVVLAENIFAQVLKYFSEIWPPRLQIDGVNLGDVGRHECVKGPGKSQGLVPFHKLSQWLSYSLVESFELCGFAVEGVNQLTGLAEYRNGGLFLDSGLLSLKDPALATQEHAMDSQLMVEWRALTIVLLDKLATQVKEHLDQKQLSLGQILQGGSWAAGRQLAFQKRTDGQSPLLMSSDGTVF